MRQNVEFYGNFIDTLVTFDPSMVVKWISDVEWTYKRHLHKLVVGLDSEFWKKPDSNARAGFVHEAATLQLSVGPKCLIFQLLHAQYMPHALLQFLNNPNYTFVEVGIEEDAEKLSREYGIKVSKVVDRRELAAEEKEDWNHPTAGLKRLEKELEKPKNTTENRPALVDFIHTANLCGIPDGSYTDST